METQVVMSTRTKFMWGGLGALTPIVATFVIVDIETMMGYLDSAFGAEANPYLAAGYGLRVLALFIVGGVWACLHKQEYEPKKLFQLGIVAPAMITAMLNASNVYDDAHPEHDRASAVTISLISNAYAADDEAKDGKSDALDGLIRGFLGKRGK